MRQIVAVLLQLPLHAVLLDGLALQFNIENTAGIRRQFQKIELLADVLDRVGEVEAVKIRGPAVAWIPRRPVPVLQKRHQPVRQRAER